MRVNVTPNGRLVLPAALRKRLGIETGGQLIVESEGDAVRLSTPDRSLDEAGELFRSCLTGDDSVADEVIADRRAESERDPTDAGADEPERPSMADVTRLSSKFRISVPKAVRERQGWAAGQEFVFVPRGEGVLLMPVPDIDDLRGIAKGAGTRDVRDRTDPDA